ncbi:MAG TPA: carboxypeptidase regulatory-like domain-containing protein, partial [Candidatus Baltobacteraceae bacterium]|nr:carboxypeptidase regulatory-like domain-containing protein [Candidatus Baltobacteraceae bacterium]
MAVLLLVSMLGQGTWALAGTTGGISGYVRDTDGAPVSGAKVTATSPSETSTSTADASGHYEFLSLAPDTYTLSAAKDQYQPTSVAGVSVFADQVQTVSLTMPKALKTIASVRSQAASSLVKSGVGGDIYNVDPAQMQKTAALGGGGNLDTAYSAIASVPGLVVGTGAVGWNQAVIVRGNNPWFTGFEYDGIPVNRAFDNYTSSTASNLGLQELQVYTGGGPASISSSGTSGFINQVIKTGTYPGYGLLSGGLSGVGAFYHSLRAEAGGASPNRNFSYYVGVSGYDQAFRPVDNNSGASYFTPGSQYGTYGFLTPGFFDSFAAYGAGVMNVCGPNGAVDNAIYAALGAPPPYGQGPIQGCLSQMPGTWASTPLLSDRENVVNLHFAVPRANGQRDDLQLMWSASRLQQYAATSPNLEGQINNWMLNMTGFPYCGPSGTDPGCAADQAAYNTGLYNLVHGPAASQTLPWQNYPYYQDSYQYNLPFGTNVQPNGTPLQPGIYYQANTPAHSFQAPLPLNDLNDLNNNDTGIIKAQWTHPFNSQSFVRLMGYSFFSDWTENGAISGFAAPAGFEWLSPNYDLITHTAGGMLQYFNQLSDKHLLQFTGNYTHANVNRFNHSGGGSTSTGSTPLGLISNSNGVYTCYDATTGDPVPCYSGSYKSSAGFIAGGGVLPAPTGTAASNGAYWATLQDGNASGTYNSVIPNFYSASLADQWRPTDKLTINASVRWDQYSYNLPNANVAQNPFYAQIVQNYACVNPTNNVVQVSPLAPGAYPPANPVFTDGACDPGFVHPNGVGGNPMFTLNTPSVYTLRYYQPRISGTFTQNPDTVWRFSAGRYAEPPLSAAVDYLYRGGSGSSLWTNFLGLGTYSPFHPIPGQTSAQYDLSLEKRIHNTPLSFKITPFYADTSNWEQQSFIGAGFVTQIPVGKSRSYGVETQLNYGNFNAEGLSGLISFTYTKSQVQFQNLLGSNQINDMNLAIQNFNALTKGGGGAPCYTPFNASAGTGGTPDPACAAGSIANPYYNMAQQGLFDPSGWYDQALYALKPGVNTSTIGFYNSPFVTNLVLNYRHQKFAITPSIQFQAGTKYGSPYDIVGVDPRDCGANQATTGASTSTNCDY